MDLEYLLFCDFIWTQLFLGRNSAYQFCLRTEKRVDISHFALKGDRPRDWWKFLALPFGLRWNPARKFHHRHSWREFASWRLCRVILGCGFVRHVPLLVEATESHCIVSLLKTLWPCEKKSYFFRQITSSCNLTEFFDNSVSDRNIMPFDGFFDWQFIWLSKRVFFREIRSSCNLTDFFWQFGFKNEEEFSTNSNSTFCTSGLFPFVLK